MSEQYATDRMVENLEDRKLFAITTETEVVRVPGPTDVVLIVGKNPRARRRRGRLT